jgi:hypothetical protein
MKSTHQISAPDTYQLRPVGRFDVTIVRTMVSFGGRYLCRSRLSSTSRGAPKMSSARSHPGARKIRGSQSSRSLCPSLLAAASSRIKTSAILRPRRLLLIHRPNLIALGQVRSVSRRNTCIRGEHTFADAGPVPLPNHRCVNTCVDAAWVLLRHCSVFSGMEHPQCRL